MSKKEWFWVVLALVAIHLAGLITPNKVKGEDYLTYCAEHLLDHKALHVAGEWGITGYVYAFTHDPGISLGLALSVGAAKEALDIAGGADPLWSLGDLAFWDLGGCLLGLKTVEVLGLWIGPKTEAGSEGLEVSFKF